MGTGFEDPGITDDVRVAQIRFALSELSARNGAHTFEELCRHVARQRICSNILPATGPVSAGGDQGRDFETFRSYLAAELGPHGAFLGLISDGAVVFTCTLQSDDLRSKIRSDVRRVFELGPAPKTVYAMTASSLPVGRRHELIDEVAEQHGAILEVVDGVALAEQLADPDLYWVAERFLALPAQFAPQRREGEGLPAWYLRSRDTWRELGVREASEAFVDLLSIKEALRFAARETSARPDVSFWLEVLAPWTEPSVPMALRQRARYESAYAVSIAFADIRRVDPLLDAYFSEVLELTRAVDLQDASHLLLLVSAAAARELTDFTAIQVYDHNRALLAHAQALRERALPHEEARLLYVIGYLGVQPVLVQMVDRYELEKALAELDTDDGPDSVSVTRRKRFDPIDLDGGMSAWRELAGRLKVLPAFPTEELAETLTELAPLLWDHADWPAITDAVDEAVERRGGKAAVASRQQARALALATTDKWLPMLRDLHRARANAGAGGRLLDGVDALLQTARVFAELNLTTATTHYALCAVGMAERLAAQDDLGLDRIPAAFRLAAAAQYWSGAFCTALELLERYFDTAPRLDASYDPAAPEHVQAVEMLVDIVAKSRDLVPEYEPVLRQNLAWLSPEDQTWLDALWRENGHAAAAVAAFWDENLMGRPFCDLGSERVIVFRALGCRWVVRARNELESARAGERFAAALEVLVCDLAGVDLCLPPGDVEIIVDIVDGEQPVGVSPMLEDRLRWRVSLHPWHTDAPWSTDYLALHAGELIEVAKWLFRELSLLPDEGAAAAVQSAVPLDGWDRLVPGRLYDDAAMLISADFERARRRDFKSPLAPLQAPGKSSPELEPEFGPGPGYDLEKYRERIAAWYQLVPHVLRRTLPELTASEDFHVLIAQLRTRGWLDWQILVAVYRVVCGFRVDAWRRAFEAAYREAPDNLEDQVFRLPEQDSEHPVTAELITEDQMEAAWRLEVISTATFWGLQSNVTTSEHLESLLAARYGYRDVDVDHSDPFQTS